MILYIVLDSLWILYSSAACSEYQNNFPIGRNDFHDFISPFSLVLAFIEKVYQPRKTVLGQISSKTSSSKVFSLRFTSRCLKM